MCLKWTPENEDRRPKILSKTKTLWSKTKTHQSKTFFLSGKEGKTVSATNLVFILDQWVFVSDHMVFVLDQWVFFLDHRVFVLDQRVFVLDHGV